MREMKWRREEEIGWRNGRDEAEMEGQDGRDRAGGRKEDTGHSLAGRRYVLALHRNTFIGLVRWPSDAASLIIISFVRACVSSSLQSVYEREFLPAIRSLISLSD